MGRRLFDLLAVLSLVLCVATGAISWRSHKADCVWRPRFYRKLEVGFSEGVAGFAWSRSGWRYPTIGQPQPDLTQHDFFVGNYRGVWLRAAKPAHPAETCEGLVLVWHGWFLALLFALPAIRFYRRARGGVSRRRILAGLGPSCGYDLRATPSRCPECGAVPKMILISN